MLLLYTAAHGGFDLERVPLGGGAAVCQHLQDAWKKTQPFTLKILEPQVLGEQRPRDKQLIGMSEWSYGRFCRAFERKTTEIILEQDPKKTVVLINDISEGPDFRRLAAAGFRLFTIYHVDVVDYLSRMYLGGHIKPETLTRFYEKIVRNRLESFVPDILRLAVQKQRDSVVYSKGLIVPSEGMRNVLLRCYPTLDQAKVHILPWGIWEEDLPTAVDDAQSQVREQYGISIGECVLLTLSRISPEKGQDRLLLAVALWEKEADFPKQGLVVVIAGEAAFMQGRRFERKLRRLASRLVKTRVIFPGYCSGRQKQAFFALADLYIFPSRHESYGLTLLEALRSGLPAVACDSHGARAVMGPEVGEILPSLREGELPERLLGAIKRMLNDPSSLTKMRAGAKSYASRQRFSETAAKLAAILKDDR